MTSEFVDLLYSAIWSEIIAKMNTVIPARVDSYDKSGPYISATPLIDKLMTNGEPLRLGEIVKIPVVFPRTNRFKLSYPLEKGDGVLLLFSQRCIDEWYTNDGFATPASPRTYSLTDAIAIPGLFANTKGKQVTSASELEIEFDDVKITSNGKKWSIKGDMEVDGEVTANGKDLSTHEHSSGTLGQTPFPGGIAGTPIALVGFPSGTPKTGAPI